MTTRQVLEEARCLVERGWTQGASAKNLAGESVDVQDSSAVAWCALGSIWRAAGRAETVRQAACDAFIHATPEIRSPMWWNDTKGRTKDEILSAFDRAIKAAEKVKP